MNRIALLILGLLISFAGNAQQRTIRGVVVDSEKKVLPGVVILIREPRQVAVTDADGRFSLTSPPGSVTLTATYIGYLSQTIVVRKTSDSLLIQMKPDSRTLDEVVVVGYRSAMKRDMVGAVSTLPAGRSSTTSRSTPTPSAPNRTVSTFLSNPPDANSQSGQLTAGEIYDYSKWTLWQDLTKSELKEYRSLWRQAPAERYSVQLVTPDGFPVIDASVRLLDNQRNVVWQSRTDNTGRGELWANLFRLEKDSIAATTGKLTIETAVGGQTYLLNRPHQFGKGSNSITIKQPCQGNSTTVDVAFVVDATGSMGDEINYLKAEITDVISQSKQAVAGSTIRLASVFYRDKTDDYLTRLHDFSDQPDSTVAFIGEQSAGGGGDYPEAVDTALAVATTHLSWSKTAKARLLFLVLDAPPHDDEQSKASLQRSVSRAAAMGIRLIPIAASGINKSTEYLLRSMALGTNGTYIFLTDDSGIGDSHIKPSTDQYTVEKLNLLLVRVITKFTQTPDCRPVISVAPPQVRYSEQGQPIDTTAQLAQSTPELRFRYFPNPTRDFLTIESQDDIRELFVTDITGKVLMRETPGQSTVRLDMLAYPTGTYLFRFDAAQRWQTGRFLLNR